MNKTRLQVAREILSELYRTENGNVHARDGSTAKDIAFRLHDNGQILPANIIWEDLHNILQDIVERWEYSPNDDPQDIADELTEIYTHELKRWFQEDPEADEYCNEVIEEYGNADIGNIAQLLMSARCRCLYARAVEVLETIETETEE